jgi:hypothetical protein
VPCFLTDFLSVWQTLKWDFKFSYYHLSPCFSLYIINVCLLYLWALILDGYIYINNWYIFWKIDPYVIIYWLCLWWEVLT